jgi:hypothetical protein
MFRKNETVLRARNRLSAVFSNWNYHFLKRNITYLQQDDMRAAELTVWQQGT